MAIDTANKRLSVLGVGLPAPRLEQVPAGHVQKMGRHIAAFLYGGITLQVLSPTYSNSGQGSVRVLSSLEAQDLLT